MYKPKKSRCNTDNSHVNSIESNNLSTSNSDNVIVNLNLHNINIQTESAFNTLITLQKETDAESSISINNEIMDENNISKEILYHQDSAEVIVRTCDKM